MESPKHLGVVAASSPEFVSFAFECLERGQVFVPLRSADDRQRIERARVGEVRGQGVPAGPVARGGWVDARHTPRDDDSLALVAFTSGTEGLPKAVGLSHRNLANAVSRLTTVMGTNHEIREYVGVPAYHSFGFGRCRAVAAVGGKAFLPANGFDPSELARMLDEGAVNALSAVPSLLRILLQPGALAPGLAARLRWLEIGSQAMSRAEKKAVRKLFPEAVIVQHYGLTEASRSTFLEVHKASDAELDTVGRPSGDVQVRIGDDGKIRIRGGNVAATLLTADGDFDPREPNGELVTSDLGELRQGFLVHLGRADDVINVGGLKLAPDLLEARIREILFNPETASGSFNPEAASGSSSSAPAGELGVCRVPDSIRGDGLLVAVSDACSATDAELIDAVTAAAQELGVNARGATHVMRMTALPRTDNGKVKRRELTQRFVDEHGAASESPSVVTADAGANLRESLRSILAVPKVGDRDTFTTLGGDSLGYIQAALMIQRKLGYLPSGWEAKQIAELEALPTRVSRSGTVEVSVLIRALAILGIVVNHSHWLEGVVAIDGGAHLLLIPSGYSFARFQLQRVIKTDSPWPALGTFPRILVPAFLFTLLMQLRTRNFTLSTLLFYSNLVDPSAGGGISFWFINILLQIYLISFALCALPPVRKALREAPLVASSVALALAAASSAFMPKLWNTDHLYNLVPHMMGWLFVCGAALYFAQEKKWRVPASLVILLLGLTLEVTTSVKVWVVLGGLCMIWVPQVRLPPLFATATSALASASLYIYLTHWTTFGLSAKAFARGGPLVQIAAALFVGTAAWVGFDRAWDKAARFLSKRG